MRRSILTGLDRVDAHLAARRSQPALATDRLELHNKTSWRTDDLRRLIVAVHDDMGEVSIRRRIEIVYTRRGGVNGRASIGGRWIKMRVPHPKHGAFPVVTFARVLWHEIEHNLGLRHHQMGGCTRSLPDAAVMPSIVGRSVRPPAPKEKKPRDPAALVEKREAHARKMLAQWERRMKLGRTKLSAWKAKVRYYERKKAACSPAPEPTP